MINRPTHMSDDLLVSYLLNEADADARSMVEEWIIETAENRRYFEHFKLIWETSQEILTPTGVDENAAWQRFQERIQKPPQKGFVRSMSRFRVAATVMICVGLAALSYFLLQNTANKPVIVAANEAVVNRELPDGSVITLNKNSTAQYDNKFQGKQRKVQLHGEAFFKVTPNKSKPFVVEVKSVKVTVVGTAFNIRETDSSTDVMVESGIVKVESGNQEMLLNPGEKISVNKKSEPLIVQKTNDKLYNFYVTKQFVCDNTPLWKLVQTLNEAYNANIEIADPQIAKLPLTTTFRNESLENILRVVSETFNLTVEHQGNKTILK
ncbi:MAG: FecR domain-containing protein [Chitinophagaceae bacterium]|nr:FecR domain-containing protein [Chitinophagaceae bacterium]